MVSERAREQPSITQHVAGRTEESAVQLSAKLDSVLVVSEHCWKQARNQKRHFSVNGRWTARPGSPHVLPIDCSGSPLVATATTARLPITLAVDQHARAALVVPLAAKLALEVGRPLLAARVAAAKVQQLPLLPVPAPTRPGARWRLGTTAGSS